MEEQKCQRVARVGWPQGYLKAYAGYAAIFFVFMCRKHKMLQIKSNGTVSNYDTVPFDFTCSIKVFNLQMGTQNSDVHSRELP